MRTGFQLLQTRLITDTFDVKNIELKNEIEFPPLFKLFAESFQLALLSSPYFIAYFPNSEVGFEGFNQDLEKVISIYKNEASYFDKKMLPIARSGIHAGGICLCLTGENADKLYLDNEVYPGRYELIANNIFEFVRGLIEVEDGEDLSIYANIPKNHFS